MTNKIVCGDFLPTFGDGSVNFVYSEPAHKTNEQTIDYLAGLFDGDGSAFIKKQVKDGRTNYVSCLSIGMSDYEPIGLFAKTFGGDIKVYSRKGKKNQHTCFFINKRAAEVAEVLIPKIKNSRKRKAMLSLIDFAKTVRTSHGGRWHPFTNAEIELREELFNNCKALNSREKGNKHILEFKTTLANIKEATVDYLAGLFDAEGSAFITKIASDSYTDGTYYRACLKIKMVDPGPILSFIGRFGGYYHKECENDSKRNLQHCLFFRHKKAIPVASVLLPKMYAKRKRLAILCILRFLQVREFQGHSLTSEVKSIRKEQWEICKQLNTKGQNAQLLL